MESDLISCWIMGSENDPSLNASLEVDSPTTDDKSHPQKHNAATGASAAGVRAVSARVIAYYFRAPVKSFFRTRVEYAYYT